ncbi:MAG: hypothetical protein LCH81_20305 [Bacteroidetes bacterium]|nr:hypothetical protein [Bacteroidota bacterium]
MKDIEPKIKPLYRDLKELNIGIYLASTDFDRYAIISGIEDIWIKAIEAYDRESSVIFITTTDMTPWDREEALRILMNWTIRSSQPDFNSILFTILSGFIEWNNKLISLEKIYEDLKLAGFPHSKIEALSKVHSNRQDIIKNINLSFEKIEVSSKVQDDSKSKKFIESKKTAWIEQIAKGDVEATLDDIKNYAQEKKDNNIIKLIINLSSRWYRNKQSYNKGLIKNEEKEMEINKVNEALVDLIIILT